MAMAVPRVGFIMEQALGHVTYTRNLRSAFAADNRLKPVWLPAQFEKGGPLDRLPGVRSNWTVRGSLRGYLALRAQGGPGRFDAVLFHTQTVALTAPVVARSVPVILSLDATPLGFDRVGSHYSHRPDGSGAVGRVKRALHRSVFRSAAALTTWSQWAKDSLTHDYGVDPDRVTVIPPGVDLSLFPFGGIEKPVDAGRVVRVLFVGGDFERKGGNLLLESMRNGLAGLCELQIVTRTSIPPTPGVSVYQDLGPNDPRLIRLYQEADIFALPTYADCLAVVLGEAMAAGLPIITTSVAGQPEAVQDGLNGLIISHGDQPALGRALRRLIADPALRRSMGRQGRQFAEARFDVATNAGHLVDVIHDGIDRRRRFGFTGAAAQPGGSIVR